MRRAGVRSGSWGMGASDHLTAAGKSVYLSCRPLRRQVVFVACPICLPASISVVMWTCGRPARLCIPTSSHSFQTIAQEGNFARSCFRICSYSCGFCLVFCFGSMAPRHTLRLRHLLASLKEVCQALVDSHPDIVAAVHSLEAAVNVGFPVGSRGKPVASVDKRFRRLHNQIHLLRQQKATQAESGGFDYW